MRTQVGIIGAGPAGLMLAHLLHLNGVESVVLESRTRDYVEQRIRAGVLEQGVIDLMKATGLGERMMREGLAHDGVKFRFENRTQRVDLKALCGQVLTVYAQHEVVKDLIAARASAGLPLLFEAEASAVEDVTGQEPRIRFMRDGKVETLTCDFIAGCDGFHGVSRTAMPADTRTYEREYPFGWLGILAEAPPASHELIYANHPNGFGLLSMRSPTVTRAYLQCAPDEDLSLWPDDRLWAEFKTRFHAADWEGMNEGRITQKGVTAMRSFVTEPMRHGRLFLAGDAAHIVPPTGAKGMNLAIHDVWVLAEALKDFYRGKSSAKLDAYSEKCLKRIWRAQHFSWWMTAMLHKFPDASPYDARRQLAELELVTSTEAGAKFLAQNYTGAPFI